MAWNDIYQDNNAVQLSVSIGGHNYTPGNNTEIKVERKIGDTLNKFSLSLIDDGSDNYIQFERIVTNRFVNIDIIYGNSTKGKSVWTGFVVDYQPVFFGPSSKLTVTGYITRKQSGLPDQTSPYLYYIDWAPVIGKRKYVGRGTDGKDTEGDWEELYNGNFSFTSDSFGNALKDKPVEDTTGAQKQLEDTIREQKKAYGNRNAQSIANSILSQIQSYDWANADYYTQQLLGWDENGNIISPTSAYIYYDENTGEYDLSSIYLLTGNATEPIPYGDDPWHELTIGEADSWSDILSSATISQWKSINEQLNKYDEALNNLRAVTSDDTYGEAAKKFFGTGHVPWDYELMDAYEGNVLFQKFSHPADSRRSIARVVPDLFIEWDKDLPAAPEYLDKEGHPKSGSLDTFPDEAINDIKVFGLMYQFNEAEYTNHPSDPYSAYELLEDDIHGVRRVYKVQKTGVNYVWVGDIPNLYNEWKNHNWKYSEATSEGYHTNAASGSTSIPEYEFTASYNGFKARKQRPNSYNVYYNKRNSANNGWSDCIYGSPTVPDLNVLRNCVGWACGRFNEIIGPNANGNGMQYPGFNCDARDFITRARSYYPELEITSYPTIGGILVWGGAGENHVAVCEEIYDSNNILTSESGYGASKDWWNDHRNNGNGNWGGKHFLGNIVNPVMRKATDTSDIPDTYVSNNATWETSAENYTHFFEKETSYKVGDFLIYDKNNHGKVLQAFTTDKGNKDEWKKLIAEGKIKEFTKEEWAAYHLKGEGNKSYKITALKEDKEKGVKAMSAEERVTTYLKAAYRSAMPLTYGVVYISDIVAQLCVLEGWKVGKIVATIASDYKSSFLNMNGMSALEYISQQLCPNAIEDGGTGRSGFQCYFDKSGAFYFEPVDVNGADGAYQISLGYNIKNSPVLSFTVRSNGQILMLGVDENYDGVDNLRGDTIAITPDKNKYTMSEAERQLGGTAMFFNLSLYNYYGYDLTSKEDYTSFTNKLVELGGADKALPYGTTLIRRSYKSSTSSSTAAATEALNELQQLQRVSIKAELTMVGDNTIVPGKYIQINNYTRRGKHYTSGRYYVKTITDSVNKANGFTQQLELYRWSSTVNIMNESPNTSRTVHTGITSKAEEALQQFQQGGLDKMDKWLQENLPDADTSSSTNTNTNSSTGGGSAGYGGGRGGGAW